MANEDEETLYDIDSIYLVLEGIKRSLDGIFNTLIRMADILEKKNGK